MFFILSKLVTFLLSPFNVVVILLLTSVLLRMYISKKITGRWNLSIQFPWSRRLLILAGVILIVFSNPLILRWTVMGWETVPVGLPVNDCTVKRVVVLGGMSAEHVSSGRIRFGSGGDRLMQTLMLVQTNPVEHLIISGGSSAVLINKRGEAAFLHEFLTGMGLNSDMIIVDSLSRNTYENAVNTRQIFEANGWSKNIVLVTSAWHMPRARMVFEKQGFLVRPIGADPLYPFSPAVPSDYIIPSVSALSSWELLLKEWVGIFAYWVKGYL
jgi:uncharacterized SAM-binding protein YcdF (DUF218 family)